MTTTRKPRICKRCGRVTTETHSYNNCLDYLRGRVSTLEAALWPFTNMKNGGYYDLALDDNRETSLVCSYCCLDGDDVAPSYLKEADDYHKDECPIVAARAALLAAQAAKEAQDVE